MQLYYLAHCRGTPRQSERGSEMQVLEQAMELKQAQNNEVV